MRLSVRRWPAWAMALALSAFAGVTTVIFNFVIPAFDSLGVPAWLNALRMAAYLAVIVGAICYAGLTEEVFSDKWLAVLHRAAAGLIGGAACALMLEKHFDVQTLAMSAAIGAVLSAAGLFGLVARGL